MNYHEKYLKYKLKYLTLLENFKNSTELSIQLDTNKYVQDGGSTKFICKPNKPRYKEICTVDNNGSYKSKKDCEEDCDPKFISIQLKKANLHKESLQFYFFIQDLINKEEMSIYIKGGNVIGLAVLKLIYEV